MAAIDRKPTNSLVLMVKFFFTTGPRVLPRKSAFAMNLFCAKKRLLSGFRRCSCSVRAAYGFCARIRFDLLDIGFHRPDI
jgi:hypothetical protein